MCANQGALELFIGNQSGKMVVSNLFLCHIGQNSLLPYQVCRETRGTGSLQVYIIIHICLRYTQTHK